MDRVWESTTSDLVIGARFSKNTDFFRGAYVDHRIWSRTLAAQEWQDMYQREKRWFP